MEQFILFGTAACHLCEQAEQIVQSLPLDPAKFSVSTVDIAEQPQWQPRYATRIPVLYHPATQNELGWPFGLAQANAFIIKELTDD